MSNFNAQIGRLYDAIFDRAPDAEGLAFWNDAIHRGLTMDGMSDQFITVPEFAATYGQPTNLGFVESIYQNILNRPGEADGVAFWTRVLSEGLADRGYVALQFSESPEHLAQMNAPVLSVPPVAEMPLAVVSTPPAEELPPPVLATPPAEEPPPPVLTPGTEAPPVVVPPAEPVVVLPPPVEQVVLPQPPAPAEQVEVLPPTPPADMDMTAGTLALGVPVVADTVLL
jgi:hypothetical protein